jgi:D-beta-D-heptose 7-phosphate kinase/D-beta-D-heptose 1-phosphate adenosyltransferase
VPEGERAALLGALNCVDAVVIFSEDTPLRLVEQVSPDVLVKGQDYRIDDVVGREWVETHGGRVELVPLLPDRSTSRLQQRIQQREEAAAVLKRGGALASQVMPPAENK